MHYYTFFPFEIYNIFKHLDYMLNNMQSTVCLTEKYNEYASLFKRHVK